MVQLIHRLLFLPMVVGFCVCSLFWYALLSVLSTFVIILLRKRELIAILYLSSCCLMTLSVLWLFCTATWVCLLCVIVVFPDHTHFLFGSVNLIYDTYLLQMQKKVHYSIKTRAPKFWAQPSYFAFFYRLVC